MHFVYIFRIYLENVWNCFRFPSYHSGRCKLETGIHIYFSLFMLESNSMIESIYFVSYLFSLSLSLCFSLSRNSFKYNQFNPNQWKIEILSYQLPVSYYQWMLAVGCGKTDRKKIIFRKIENLIQFVRIASDESLDDL